MAIANANNTNVLLAPIDTFVYSGNNQHGGKAPFVGQNSNNVVLNISELNHNRTAPTQVADHHMDTAVNQKSMNWETPMKGGNLTKRSKSSDEGLMEVWRKQIQRFGKKPVDNTIFKSKTKRTKRTKRTKHMKGGKRTKRTKRNKRK